MNINFNTATANQREFPMAWLSRDIAAAVFLSNQAMTRATFNLAMMSPSRRAGTIIRSTKLTLEADLLLPTIAHECGCETVSEFMRQAAQFYAQSKKATHAAALKAAMHYQAIGSLILIGWIYAQPIFRGSFDDSVEMRRGKTVRCAGYRNGRIEFEEAV